MVGRICGKTLDTLDERHRRSVIGHGLERSGKGAACLVPMSRSIGGKSFTVVGPELDLPRGQLALAPNDLKNRLWVGLTEHYDSVNFARLDGVVGAHNRGRRNDDAAPHEPSESLRVSRQIYGVAHDCVAHH